MGFGILPFKFNIDDANCANEWENWLRSFELFAKTNRIEDQDKHNWLLHMAGPQVQDVYYKLPPVAENENLSRGPLKSGFVPFMQTDYDVVVEKLQNFFAPRRNAAFERHIFRRIKQSENERIDLFAMRLRAQADKCDFKEQIEENVKEQLAVGASSEWVRERILKRADESLNDIIKNARIHEVVQAQSKTLNGKFDNSSPTVSADVCKIEGHFRKRPYTTSQGGWKSRCSRCGSFNHRSSYPKCPAMGKICRKCNGKNHFENQCLTRSVSKRKWNRFNQPDENKPESKKIKTDDISVQFIAKNDTHTPDDDYDDVFGIESGNLTNEIWCLIGDVEVKVVIDSGSKYNIVDRDSWAELKSKNIKTINRKKQVDKKFKAYGGKELNLMGVFKAMVNVGKKEIEADFYVVDEKGKVLLGRDTSILLNVLKIGYDVNSIDDKNCAFSKIKGVLVELPIKPNTTGVIQRYRRVPAPLEKLVDNKIDSMLREGIIEKVNGPSKWVSPLVVVPKQDGDIRICIDMRRANEMIDRENHPLPTIEDFLPHLGSAKCFSKLDVQQAFHQV